MVSFLAQDNIVAKGVQMDSLVLNPSLNLASLAPVFPSQSEDSSFTIAVETHCVTCNETTVQVGFGSNSQQEI